jgi:pentatricopeptide repeat protein
MPGDKAKAHAVPSAPVEKWTVGKNLTAEGRVDAKSEISDRVDKKRKIMSPEEMLARARCRELNREIAGCASKKDATRAMEAFAAAKATGWSNSHTYSSMINTFIRCGMMTEAEAAFEELSSHERLNLDTITCTTMLKGYAGQGDISKCVELMEKMDNAKPRVLPNIRTINTFLRCCLMTGEIEHAEAVVATVKDLKEVEPDMSTWEYTATLLCQGLQVDKVMPLMGRLKTGGDLTVASGLAAIKIALARAQALLGDWKGCRKALKGASDAIDEEETLEQVAMFTAKAIDGTMDDNDYDNNSDEDEDRPRKKFTEQATTGGKKAWKSATNNSRDKSLELYRGHKRTEARTDIDTIRAFVDKFSQSEAGKDKVAWAKMVLSLYKRVFSNYNMSGAVKDGDNVNVRNFLMAIRKRFGLEALLERAFPAVKAKKEKRAPDEPVVHKRKPKKGDDTAFVSRLSPEGLVQWEAFEDSFAALVDTKQQGGTLNLSKVFGNDLPCKLEICSGAGEWAHAQAKADVGKANWLTLEMRHDRVYQTFARTLFESASASASASTSYSSSSSSMGLANLATLGGDAMRVVPDHIAPNSIACVCVNHPEPPQQTGSFGMDYKSQGKHLLTDDFFDEIGRVIKLGGFLTVMTDNLWYAKLLLRQVSAASGLMTSKALVSIASCGADVVERSSGVVLFKGTPDSVHGHMAEASSYFDRLWKRNQQPERYFLVLEKKEVVNSRKTFDFGPDSDSD